MTAPDSRLKLAALILVFFGPLLLAMLIYFNPLWFTVSGGDSHGELITPAQPLATFEGVSFAGRALPNSLLSGKWTLLYWNGADCDLACEADLFKMRQVRLSLSKDIERVQPVYLASAPATDSRLEQLLARHPRLIKAYPKPGAFLEQIGARSKKNIYVVDPLGNLMMRYSATATSKGMLKDLKRLLRVSRIG